MPSRQFEMIDTIPFSWFRRPGERFIVPCRFDDRSGWVRVGEAYAKAYTIMEQLEDNRARGVQLVRDRKAAEAICRLTSSTRR